MKKEWVEPEILVQQFVANEYVAACYKIRCTTPNNNSTYKSIYEDTNKNGAWDRNDKLIYSNWFGFEGCNNWHIGIIRDEAPAANGFVTNGRQADPVFYWEEKFNDGSLNIHVMVPGKENYETNPNAS